MLKMLTCGYVAVLTTIVLLADLGQLVPLTGWLHRLPWGDKTCHFLLVGGLSFLLCATLSHDRPRRRVMVVLATIVGLAAFSTLEEFSQALLVHRRFDQLDMLANVAGTCVFGAAALLLPTNTRSSRLSAGVEPSR